MTKLERRYHNTFGSLGRALRPRDATPAREIAAAERSLRCRIPEPLRIFYRLAGRATDFISFHDQFLQPKDWTCESGKLVFMAENQAVVLYGTEAGIDAPENPAVFIANNVQDPVWYKVCDSCSEFVDVMVHWEGAFGGAMATGGTAVVSPRMKAVLDRDWMFVGEVNEMWAYRKRGRAVCYVKWSDGWRIYGGATSAANLNAIARELSVVWDS